MFQSQILCLYLKKFKYEIKIWHDCRIQIAKQKYQRTAGACSCYHKVFRASLGMIQITDYRHPIKTSIKKKKECADCSRQICFSCNRKKEKNGILGVISCCSNPYHASILHDSIKNKHWFLAKLATFRSIRYHYFW